MLFGIFLALIYNKKALHFGDKDIIMAIFVATRRLA